MAYQPFAVYVFNEGATQEFVHQSSSSWKMLFEWNSFLTIGIWRKWGWFSSLDVAWPVLAVKFWTGRTKEWKSSEDLLFYNRHQIYLLRLVWSSTRRPSKGQTYYTTAYKPLLYGRCSVFQYIHINMWKRCRQ